MKCKYLSVFVGLFSLVIANDDNLDPLIVGGTEVNVGNYPWMIKLIRFGTDKINCQKKNDITTNKKNIKSVLPSCDLFAGDACLMGNCGATIVNQNPIVILTAAHCFNETLGKTHIIAQWQGNNPVST